MNEVKIFNADRQKNIEVNNLLQRIKYEIDKQGGTSAYFPLFIINGNRVVNKESPLIQFLFKELEKRGVIEISERDIEEMNKDLEENRKLKNPSLIVEGWWINIIEPQFSHLCEEYEKKTDKNVSNKTNSLSDNERLVFEADLTKEFAIWKKSQNKNRFNMKKKINGEFFVSGKDIFDLLKNQGKALIIRENKNNILKILPKKMHVTPDEIENLFFYKDGKYGIKRHMVRIIK